MLGWHRPLWSGGLARCRVTDHHPAPPTSPQALQSRWKQIASPEGCLWIWIILIFQHVECKHTLAGFIKGFETLTLFRGLVWPDITSLFHLSVSTSDTAASPQFNTFSQNWWRSLKARCLCYVTYWRKSQKILYCHISYIMLDIYWSLRSWFDYFINQLSTSSCRSHTSDKPSPTHTHLVPLHPHQSPPAAPHLIQPGCV